MWTEDIMLIMYITKDIYILFGFIDWMVNKHTRIMNGWWLSLQYNSNHNQSENKNIYYIITRKDSDCYYYYMILEIITVYYTLNKHTLNNARISKDYSKNPHISSLGFHELICTCRSIQVIENPSNQESRFQVIKNSSNEESKIQIIK